LKEITQLPEFKTALAKVCAQLKLFPDQVERTSLHLYAQLSLHVHGNTSQMTISAEEFCPLEVGALLCFFETSVPKRPADQAGPGPKFEACHLPWQRPGLAA